MRVVTLEEHVTFPEMITRMSPEELAKHPIGQSPAIQKLAPKLADVNGERLQSMDANGISLQVLSVTGAGADLLQPDAGPLFASTYNDLIARKIAENPTRFKAFA